MMLVFASMFSATLDVLPKFASHTQTDKKTKLEEGSG